MGCFLSCFRSGREQPGDLLDPLVVESRLGDAFVLDDGKKRDASGKLQEDAGHAGGVDDELLEEANYLKQCGTISKTPAELLKFSSPVRSDDTNKITSEAMASKVHSSELFNSDEHDILRLEEDTMEGTEHLLDAESKHLTYLQDKHSSQKATNEKTDSIYSPFPTPLVLRGEMQTPGTVYNALTSKAGKRERSSREFIYPVLRPIENNMQWMEVKVDSPMLSNPPKRRYLSPEEPKSQNGNQQLLEDGALSEQKSEYGKNGVSSLSNWLKPSSDTEGNIIKEPLNDNNISDVPIFATFGLNWDNDNPTPVLPKAWNGNGIPNTTAKYKEDKVVSWHATPFEERLLKVLSSEKAGPERKISGKLIQLEENAE